MLAWRAKATNLIIFMPELPEVQTVVNQLQKKISGKIFSNSLVKVAKMTNKNFEKLIKNKKIKKINRLGKMIIIELNDNKFLLVHLKMTGQLIYIDKRGKAAGGGHPINSKDFKLTKPNKFTRIILNFKDKSQLLFHDLRKFGWMKIVTKDQLSKIKDQYGVEPLSKDFTLEKFKSILKRRPNIKIKQLLMSQELIAGIGNIYADESLFVAKIKPPRLVKSLKAGEIKELHQAIIKTLKTAIKFGGTSVNTYVQLTGQKGNFKNKLKVYQRAGEKCFRCFAVLKRIKINGRGTVYCESCQK